MLPGLPIWIFDEIPTKVLTLWLSYSPEAVCIININTDTFYAELIDIDRDLSSEASQRVNARLILLLANHIGDNRVLEESMKIAKNLD